MIILVGFKIILLYALLETEPDKVEEFAGAILEINPVDRVALTALDRHHFRNDRYERGVQILFGT